MRSITDKNSLTYLLLGAASLAYLGKCELFMWHQFDGCLVDVSSTVVILCVDLFEYRILKPYYKMMPKTSESQIARSTTRLTILFR